MAALDDSRLFEIASLGAGPTPVADTDYGPVSRGGVTKPVSWLNIAAYLLTKVGLAYMPLLAVAGKAGYGVRVKQDASGFELSGDAAAPTIAAGTGAGTSPTVAVASGSSGKSGQLNITTGTGPAASGATVATLTYASALGSAPRVIITPGNAAAAALSGATQVWSSPGSSTWLLKGGTSALTGATAYVWNYSVEF